MNKNGVGPEIKNGHASPSVACRMAPANPERYTEMEDKHLETFMAIWPHHYTKYTLSGCVLLNRYRSIHMLLNLHGE